MIRTFNMDCMEFMASVPDGHYDLAIVDPPYGSGIMRKNKYQRHRSDYSSYRNKSIPEQEYYQQLYRISKHSIIWGCQYQMPYLKPEGSFIIWDKKADPDKHNMSACDVAWYSKREKIRMFSGHWCGAVKFEKEPTIHIHQKPVGLYKWLLHHFARPGFKILDTHGGSMSHAIAAYDLGFDLDIIEIDPIHYADACKRLADYKKQLKMF